MIQSLFASTLVLLISVTALAEKANDRAFLDLLQGDWKVSSARCLLTNLEVHSPKSHDVTIGFQGEKLLMTASGANVCKGTATTWLEFPLENLEGQKSSSYEGYFDRYFGQTDLGPAWVLKTCGDKQESLIKISQFAPLDIEFLNAQDKDPAKLVIISKNVWPYGSKCGKNDSVVIVSERIK